MNIISGLANGCDTIAYMSCMQANGKTIAILPSILSQIVPANNKQLAFDIVDNGGLLVSEYILPPPDRYLATKRFIERDRLQAMFSKAIVLSASFCIKELGDCGSRHAMGKAIEYNIYRTIIYNPKIDKANAMFGLNRSYYENNQAKILTNLVLPQMIKHSIFHNTHREQNIL